MIDRPTIIRIVLATGPIPPLWFSADDGTWDQIGADAELITLAQNDIIAIANRYAAYRGRMVGDRRISFQAAAVLARIDWIEELLAAMGSTDLAGGAVRHLAEQLRECQIERDSLIAQIDELQEDLETKQEEINRLTEETEEVEEEETY